MKNIQGSISLYDLFPGILDEPVFVAYLSYN